MIRWKVYCLCFPNGKEYVGVTKKRVRARFEQHLSASRNGGLTLHSAIRKYEQQDIQLEVLSIHFSEEDAKSEERRQIACRDTLRPNGYNSTLGGNGVIDPSGLSEGIRIQRMKKTMASREYKEKQRIIQSSVWTPEKRKLHSEKVKQLWQKTEYREHQKKVHTDLTAKCHFKKTLTHEERSAVAQGIWRRPGLREKQRETTSKAMTSKRRAEISLAVKNHFAQPGVREAHRNRMKEVMNKPEVIQKCREAHL